jgi:signal transduction histidine kinase/ActR/RegA family two-component response regulator
VSADPPSPADRAPLGADDPGASEVARLSSEVAALRQRLADARRQAEALARVARLVNEALDPSAAAQLIADVVLDLLGVRSSAIRLFRPDGQLGALALGGWVPDYTGNVDLVPPGEGLSGRAAVEGRALWTEDIRTDPRFQVSPELRQRYAAFGIVAGLAAPLRVAGRVTGVLSVGGPTPRRFTDDEVALLQTFADQAAVALDSARLLAESDARRREAEVLAERLRILHDIDRAILAEHSPAAIAEAVVWPLRDLLGVPRAIVNLFDLAAGTVEWLVAVGRRRIHRGPGVRYSIALAGDLDALRRGEPQIVDVQSLPQDPDTAALLASGVRVYMVVPMIADGELIGSVSFGGDQAEFPPEQVRIAQEAAAQLAIAIAHARLLERVQRQAAELEQRVEERTSQLSAANEVLGQEVAERRRAQAEADRANRAKSDFLSRMSHELRTPLNAILGFAQLLALDPLPPEQQESVDHILRGGRHLLGLINEVLDISRIETGRLPLSLEPVPVSETVRGAVALIQPSAQSARVALEVEPIDETLHVLADRQRLQQVLLNLLSNAVKYNRAGGSIRVRCETARETALRILVTDTGPGIAADKLGRLFLPFERLGAETSPIEGTGLGLALARHLIEAMGGAIAVETVEGAGSTFSVELQLIAAPSDARAEVPAAAPAPARRPVKVLYIEDNLSNLRLIESVFSRRPEVTLLSAMQGRVGLTLARDHAPDLILLDLHLPDISGEEVFRLLQADEGTRGIPVVVLSADAIPTGMRRVLAAGVRAYLTKPLDVAQLLATLDENVRRDPT